MQHDPVQLEICRVARAADMLWTYIRVGYGPDVLRCLQSVEEMTQYTSRVAALQRERRPIWEEGATPPEARTEDATEERRRERWLDGLEQVLSLGPDAIFLPLINLEKMARSAARKLNAAVRTALSVSTSRLATSVPPDDYSAGIDRAAERQASPSSQTSAKGSYLPGECVPLAPRDKGVSTSPTSYNAALS